jgi:TolB-like protein
MKRRPAGINRFWKELKRRHVPRSLAIYAGTAFIILEASTIIFPRLGLPEWTIDLVLYLLILGAVVTMVVSWVFDLTPRGIEKTKTVDEVPDKEKEEPARGWRITTYISLVVIAGLLTYNLAAFLSRSEKGPIQSLVLLPFDNFTGDDELEYFVAGMHSSLIGDMGKIEGLRVISKTSANSYRNLEKPIHEIASDLRVDAVVETMVSCIGDTICTQFKLFSTTPAEQLIWMKSYETDKNDILNLYNWVIRDISEEIKLPLSDDRKELLDKERTIDPDAYENYLKGKFNMGFLTQESQMAAIDYFNQALVFEPEYAEAYAGIAGIWGFLKQMDYVSPDEADPEIKRYMEKALELDVFNDEILYYDGIIKIWTDFNWAAGEASLRKCLDINPNFAEARAYYSHLMMLLKRPEEMREQMKIALRTDPRNPLIQVLTQVEQMAEMKWDSCIENSEELQKVMPNNPLLMLILFICYAETGAYDKAVNELEKVFNQLADTEVIQILQDVYMKQGFQPALLAAADNWTERFETASAQHANMLYAYGGDQDKLFFWLERMYIRRDPASPYLGIMPYLRHYNDHPRYLEILKRMNLPTGEFL